MRRGRRVRISFPGGFSFYAEVLDRVDLADTHYYIVRPISRGVEALLRSGLGRRGVRANVGRKHGGFLMYVNGNFVLAPFREIRYGKSVPVSVYHKGKGVLRLIIQQIIILDALGKRKVYGFSSMLRMLPDGVYESTWGKVLKRGTFLLLHYEPL